MIINWSAIIVFVTIGHLLTNKLVLAMSIFDGLPPIITDESHLSALPPSTHQFLFNPIGKYATDVHYMHIRIPIFFKPVLQNMDNIITTMKETMNFGQQTTMATNPIIQHCALEITTQVDLLRSNFVDIIDNLPNNGVSEYHRKKRFFDILFGLTGTAFGIANSIAIANINTQIAKNIHRTDLLIDISQIHENHLHNIDDQIINIDTTLREFIQFNPSYVTSTASTMMFQAVDVYNRISNAVSQAQLHRLSPLTFSHSVLKTIKTHIDLFALDKNYVSFVTHISDLYQLEASFVYQPNNLTFNIILHVPLVKPEYLLTLNQYIPFPLSQDFSANHSLTPAVGGNDILAFGHMNTFKIVSQTDLSSCHRMGDTYFCKGRNVLQTRMEETCLGAIFARHLTGMKTYCKFELKPLREQVFQLSRNKWQVFSKTQFTTSKVCENSASPMAIGFTTTVTLESGCKVLLQSNILYAEHEESVTIEPLHFTWAWNISAIFPDIPKSEFSQALQSLHEYGLHVVEATDIAHHLKFNDFSDNIPTSISRLFTNPFNYVSGFLAFGAIIIGIYFFCKCRNQQSPQQFAPTAPPAPAGIPLHFIYPQL